MNFPDDSLIEQLPDYFDRPQYANPFKDVDRAPPIVRI